MFTCYLRILNAKTNKHKRFHLHVEKLLAGCEETDLRE